MARTARLRRLTAIAVKRYAENGSGEDRDGLHDGGGLYARRREASTYWYLRLASPITGKFMWLRLFSGDAAGHYPEKTLDDARREAERLWKLRDQGKDPRLEAERARQAELDAIASDRLTREAAAREASRRCTVRELFNRWATTELAPFERTDGKRTGRKDAGASARAHMERRVFPTLGDVRAADVRKADLMSVLDLARAAGQLRTANVLLAELKQMFRFGLAREIVDRNPLETVLKRDAGGPNTERDRFLSVDEIGALLKALPSAALNQRSALAVPTILGTACRVGELMAAKWEHIDTRARTWELPDTKGQRSHTIHLSDFTVGLFQRLAALREPGEWVFPNTRGTGPVDPKSFGKQLADRQPHRKQRLKGRCKATTALQLVGGRWTAHDLRRTAATLMASLGVSGDVIDECLNHAIESRVRRTYIRDRRPAEQARAFDALGNRLEEIIAGKSRSTAKVVKRQVPAPRAAAWMAPAH